MKYIASLLFLALTVVASADPLPRPPTRLCIGEDCTSTAGGKIKWHPGHYVKLGEDEGVSTSGTIEKVTESNFLVGVDASVYMGQVETSKGVYDWSSIDALIGYLTAHKKQLILQMLERRFGSTSPAGIVPADLQGQLYKTKTGTYGLAIWRPENADRVIDWTRAFCARYDRNSHVEMIRIPGESSPSTSASATPSDFSRTALATQLIRIWKAAQESCPHTLVVASVNNLFGEEAGLIDSAMNIPVAFGSPDALDVAGTSYFGSAGYAGSAAYYTIASGPVLGGKDDNGPASNVIRWCQNSGRLCTHLSWVTWATTQGNTWPDVKAAIGANPQLFTSCPSRYKGNCDTSN